MSEPTDPRATESQTPPLHCADCGRILVRAEANSPEWYAANPDERPCWRSAGVYVCGPSAAARRDADFRRTMEAQLQKPKVWGKVSHYDLAVDTYSRRKRDWDEFKFLVQDVEKLRASLLPALADLPPLKKREVIRAAMGPLHDQIFRMLDGFRHTVQTHSEWYDEKAWDLYVDWIRHLMTEA